MNNSTTRRFDAAPLAYRRLPLKNEEKAPRSSRRLRQRRASIAVFFLFTPAVRIGRRGGDASFFAASPPRSSLRGLPNYAPAPYSHRIASNHPNAKNHACVICPFYSYTYTYTYNYNYNYNYYYYYYYYVR